MNRKIMLLPLSAAVLLGLASCGPTEDSKESPITPTTSSVEPPASSSVEEDYDGGISDLAVGTAAVTGVVGHKGTKGWTIDDGKASTYVYGALDDNIKVGDHVTLTGDCEGYYGLFELKNATVNKNEEKAPTLAEPVEITVADLDALHAVLAGAGSSEASWAPTNSKRYKITGLTAEDVAGYAGWSIAGFSDVEHTVGTTKCNPKIVSYYYVPGNNVTEANRNTKLYAGCTYDVYFYIGGTNAAKNVNMNIFDVVAHYDAVTGVEITGDTDVKVGAEVTLTASVLPATADQGLTWTSSDPAVATVNNGKVKGVAAGNVTITATSTADNTKKKEYAMTVSEVTSFKEIPAEGVTFDAATLKDKLKKNSYGDPFDFTLGDISWKLGVNTNLCYNSYGPSENNISVLQIKKNTGAFLSANDAVESLKSITINFYATYATQGPNFLPTITVGENTISCNEISGKETIPGTATGWKNNNYDAYSYTITYDVSSVKQTVFSINSVAGAFYATSIVIK